MTLRVAIDPRSLSHFTVAMQSLPRRVGLRHLRIALNAWGGVVKGVAQSLAREETGLLRKSIGVKVIIPDASWNVAHHGKPSRVIVGPKRKSGRFMRVKKSGGLAGFGKAQRALVAERKRLATGGVRPLARERAAVRSVAQAFAGARYRNPSRYAHLVEKGHKRGKGRSSARAYPFIAPAQRAGNTRGLSALARKLREGIEQEARKLAARQAARRP